MVTRTYWQHHKHRVLYKDILVHPGQKVSKGQTLAVLEAGAVEQQIKAADAQAGACKTSV